MTRTLQIALLTESFLNISGSILFILKPTWCLSFVMTSKEQTVPASAAVLWQVYGGLVLALTVPLLLAVPGGSTKSEKATVFEKRDIVFKTLAAGEVILIAILAWNASKPQEGSGFTRFGLLTTLFFLLPALTWHSFAVWVTPSLLRSEIRTRPVKHGKEL